VSCRSGCPTQDHESYADCCRNSGLRVAYTNSANGWDATKQRRWDNELDRYGQLVKSGIQPPGTTHREMDAAERLADKKAA
jgi:hypothetical protein